MSITNITTDFTGEVGVHPRLVRIVCNDTYATVTETNYLLSLINEGYVFYPSDYFFVMYGTTSKTPSLLTATIGTSPTSITLAPFSPSNGVTYTGSPGVGDFVKFTSSSGQVGDTGMTPSDATKTKLAAVNGATVVNNVATFSDTAGTVQSSGTLLSALQLAANIKAFNYSYAGGSATATIPLTGITTSSIATADLATQVNPAVINNVKILGSNNITVVFSADPGVSTINIIAFLAPQ